MARGNTPTYRQLPRLRAMPPLSPPLPHLEQLARAYQQALRCARCAEPQALHSSTTEGRGLPDSHEGPRGGSMRSVCGQGEHLHAHLVDTTSQLEACETSSVPSELPMQMTLSAFAQARAFEEPWTHAPERAGNYDEALPDGMGDAVATAVKFVDGGARSSTGWRFAGCGREHLVRPGVSWCYVCRK